MKYFLHIIYFFAAINSFAQAPVINNVQPLNAGPNQKIVITGSGFNTTLANNIVWFDHVKGTVTSASIYSLEVQVPAQARFSNVEVINLGNGLSAKSNLKFLPSYGGIQLDATKLTAATPVAAPYIDSNELFDIVSCDLDLDGDADLVTSRGGPTTTASITDLFIFQNTSSAIGTISFTRTSLALTLGGPTVNLACGDLNGDGKPDILASRGGNTRNEIFVMKNTNTIVGTMSFTSQAKLLLDAGEIAFRIVIRDLNGDGKPEVIVSNAHDDLNSATDNVIYVFPNQSTLSTISFASPMKLSVTGADLTYGIDAQDIDGDGKPDIIVNQLQRSDVFVFRNISTGNISFAPSLKIATAGSFIQVISSDLNNDGLLDLVATSIGAVDNNIQIWINKSTPGAIAFTASPPLQTSAGPWGIDASDIDGDGDVDIIVANRNANSLNIFRQDSPLSFTRVDIATPNNFTRNLRVGDFDKDGKSDIAYTAFPTSGLQYTLNVLRNGNCWNPVITGSSTTICTGQTVPLQTKPALGVTFDWKLGGVSQTLGAPPDIYSATAAGSYTVTLTGNVDVGCINTSSAYALTQDVATFPSDPVINNNVPCLNSALNLSTTSVADSYKWTGPNNFTSSVQNPTRNSITNADAGAYKLQLVMNNGCTSNIVSKLLDVASVPVLPVIASPSATGCAGGSVTLSVSGSGYTFQWNKNGSALVGQTSTSLSLTSLAAANEGDYSVSVTSIANSCTQETANATLKVFSTPVVDFSFSTPTCKGSTISFTDKSSGDSRGTLTYKWTFDGTNTSTLQNPTFIYNTPSAYNPNLLVSYGGACPSNVSKPLTVTAALVPNIQTSANPICVGDQTTLSISGTFSSFNWVIGATGTNSSVTITDQGLYKVTTIDANGCASKDSLTITLKPTLSPFVASSSKSIVSLGDTVRLKATLGADSYLWSPGKTLSDSISATPIATPMQPTMYIVIGKKTGFCNASDTVKVNVDTGGAVIKPPVLFSPNQDGINDTWRLSPLEETRYGDWTMTIFDGHGSQIFQQKGYNSSNAWDGTYNGKASPDGTYFYVFSNSKDKPATGSVLLVR